jgi:hypothetical protein
LIENGESLGTFNVTQQGQISPGPPDKDATDLLVRQSTAARKAL